MGRRICGGELSARSVAEAEVYGERCFHLRRLMVQHVGAIAGILDRIEGGLSQHRRPTDKVGTLNPALFGDDRLDHNDTFDAYHPGDLRVDGLDRCEKQPIRDPGGDG